MLMTTKAISLWTLSPIVSTNCERTWPVHPLSLQSNAEGPTLPHLPEEVGRQEGSNERDPQLPAK